tara:strand:- start:2379 stop:3383 length:1005 start_codon:yes stop_codon:yes gene_type:complete
MSKTVEENIADLLLEIRKNKESKKREEILKNYQNELKNFHSKLSKIIEKSETVSELKNLDSLSKIEKEVNDGFKEVNEHHNLIGDSLNNQQIGEKLASDYQLYVQGLIKNQNHLDVHIEQPYETEFDYQKEIILDTIKELKSKNIPVELIYDDTSLDDIHKMHIEINSNFIKDYENEMNKQREITGSRAIIPADKKSFMLPLLTEINTASERTKKIEDLFKKNKGSNRNLNFLRDRVPSFISSIAVRLEDWNNIEESLKNSIEIAFKTVNILENEKGNKHIDLPTGVQTVVSLKGNDDGFQKTPVDFAKEFKDSLDVKRKMEGLQKQKVKKPKM